MPGDLDLTKLNGGIYVIVWSTFEEKDLATFPTPMRYRKFCQSFPMEHLVGMI